MTSGFGVEPWVQGLRAGDLKKLAQLLRADGRTSVSPLTHQW